MHVMIYYFRDILEANIKAGNQSNERRGNKIIKTYTKMSRQKQRKTENGESLS